MPQGQAEKKHRDVFPYPFPRVFSPNTTPEMYQSHKLSCSHTISPFSSLHQSGVSGAAAPHPEAQGAKGGAERAMNGPTEQHQTQGYRSELSQKQGEQGHKTECPASLISSFTSWFSLPSHLFYWPTIPGWLPQLPVSLCPTPLSSAFFLHTFPFSLSVRSPFLLWHLCLHNQIQSLVGVHISHS